MKNVLLILLIIVIFFVVIEGVCSTVVVVTTQRQILSESLHTRYDDELGWVNIPNLNIPDMYGASVYLKTNSRGYRNSRDFDPRVPLGKLRIVCSGASFAFGYGVSNDQDWCQVLESEDPRLETVNMGQGGYGLDQTFLWYRRDAPSLESDVHILAVAGADEFLRVSWDNFNGYGKPRLKLREGELVPVNVPVPVPSRTAKAKTHIRQMITELRSYELVKRLVPKNQPETRAPDPYETLSQQSGEQQNLVLKILESLRDLDRSSHRMLILVFLPTMDDYDVDAASQGWRSQISLEANKRGIPVINLLPDFSALSSYNFAGMFIHGDIGNFQGAAGHYTVAGNKYAAKTLYGKLTDLPEFSSRLSKIATQTALRQEGR